eukprot:13746504-Heterocapsa_arctica.AAC.1
MNDHHNVGLFLELLVFGDLAAVLILPPSVAGAILVSDVCGFPAVDVPLRHLDPGVPGHLLDEQPVALLVVGACTTSSCLRRGCSAAPA